jgi:hypothetical protein
MRKLALIVLGALLFLAVFWIGLMVHFPGAALSRMIESRLASMPMLSASLSPARLGVTGLHFESLRFSLRRPEGPVSLIALKDLAISLTWRLWNGLPVQGSIGDRGRLQLFAPWEAQPLSIAVTDVALEKVPGLAVIKPIQVSGRVSLSGTVDLGGQRPKRRASFPKGSLTARAEQLEVRELNIMGTALPPAKLETVALEVTLGERIQFDRLEFRGDLQGNVTGSIRPRPANLLQSDLQLNVTASFRPEWLERLGPLQALVQGFLKDGRLRASVHGTVARPKLRAAGGRT